MDKRVIRKVWLRKASNQKMVTVPIDSNIQVGDYVEIRKVEDLDDGKTKEE